MNPMTEREIAEVEAVLRAVPWRSTEGLVWQEIVADRDARLARLRGAFTKLAEINHVHGGLADPIHSGILAECQAPSCEFSRAALADAGAGKERGDG